jgi:hypothetical protein
MLSSRCDDPDEVRSRRSGEIMSGEVWGCLAHVPGGGMKGLREHNVSHMVLDSAGVWLSSWTWEQGVLGVAVGH